MGGGKSSAQEFTEQGSAASLMAAQLAQQLFTETAPLRQGYYGAWGDIMEGKMPFGETAFPTIYGAGKAPIESQYDVARRGAMETIPTGGRLDEALTDIELTRARGLQDVIANYLNQQLQNMYGAAFGVPSITLPTMTQVGEQAVQTAGTVAQSANICCFNFLEAEGEIYQTVRWYRDDHYPKDGLVSKGYQLTASWFVPLMRKHTHFKRLIRLTMTKPIKNYTQWYYWENWYGFLFESIAKGWANIWRILGWLSGYRY